MNPSTSPAGRVEYDGDHASLVFERHLPHPPALVWRALTEPSELAEWFVTWARVDGRVGGRVEMLTGPAGFASKGDILTWEPERTFEYEWKMDPRPELPQGEDSVVRWELAPDGQGTRLRLTHRRLTRNTAVGFAPGTHAFLDRLAAWLDGEAPPDWFRRYNEVAGAYPSWQRP